MGRGFVPTLSVGVRALSRAVQTRPRVVITARGPVEMQVCGVEKQLRLVENGPRAVERLLRAVEKPRRGVENLRRAVEKPARGVESARRAVEKGRCGVEKHLRPVFSHPGGRYLRAARIFCENLLFSPNPPPMDQDTRNQLERHGNLRAYFGETKARWENVPALKKRVDVYLTRQAKLPTPPPDADRDNPVTTGARHGATLDKGTARQALATQLPAVAASVHLWLLEDEHIPQDDDVAAANQRALAARLDIRRPSALATMAAGALIGLA